MRDNGQRVAFFNDILCHSVAHQTDADKAHGFIVR
jgi:hypothetical protein